ncbi:hypothetical protein LEP1GSC088_0252 [Leptospira interrogans str. L1207]|uniref:Uncharacterized protein n=1 Tax=Leptospira interrogans serovar Zanoni str. LT2156 TaxID=1001601 RepID=M6HAM2_LEPIR|nr:hypothetical protein LEP1GSC158_0037 [Leptospira interrogans serovar Zanoni str. LT2156]EMN49755.1 hypothetical protein LEP1GSC088_0252 [Leptospira interrogans str. L1207]
MSLAQENEKEFSKSMSSYKLGCIWQFANFHVILISSNLCNSSHALRF